LIHTFENIKVGVCNKKIYVAKSLFPTLRNPIIIYL